MTTLEPDPHVDSRGEAIDHGILTGAASRAVEESRLAQTHIVIEADAREIAAHRMMRHEAFVRDQGLFAGADHDDADDDERTVVLVARSSDGRILGGVRLHPVTGYGSIDIGWWRGSRLVVSPDVPSGAGIGAALVRAACARAEAAGALRFDATVQERHAGLFDRLGWRDRGPVQVQGRPHRLVDWPIGRIDRLIGATKASLGALLLDLPAPTECGFRGDDGAPVPGSDLVAACDAILPAMVERDPEWAGWCSVLVNINDLTAMGASPVGLLDAVAGRDARFIGRVLTGLRDAARAWGVPVLGGHTQVGAPASLSVTALGRTDRPVPGGGARTGDAIRLTADLAGRWRPGYTGAQWDSTSTRRPADLATLIGVVPALEPTAAKDVSMAGLVGTTGMLAEASGTRAILDVASVPRPEAAAVGDWLTCFPGYAMVTTEQAGRADDRVALPHEVTTAVCGQMVPGSGVGLRWPDGHISEAATAAVTGLGRA